MKPEIVHEEGYDFQSKVDKIKARANNEVASIRLVRFFRRITNKQMYRWKIIHLLNKGVKRWKNAR